jgi:hypothetical protein
MLTGVETMSKLKIHLNILKRLSLHQKPMETSYPIQLTLTKESKGKFLEH